LASTLLGLDPPTLPVGQLVETAGLFGISENTARTALSRMTAAGEVEADDGRYRLTGRLLERQRRQDEGRRPRRRRWNARWRLAIVTTDRRAAADRAALRDELARLRLAEWREGVWARPDNLELAPSGLAQAHCAWATAELDDLQHTKAPSLQAGRELAAALWALGDWAAEATELLGELRSLPVDGTDVLAPGFVLSAAVLRHLASDPLLPDELLPRRWPGDELRSTYDDWDGAYRRLLAGWHRSRRGR
jgi:phenylacetic acid degradation operon negative regulatory protein